MAQEVLFPSGSAEVSSSGQAVLAKVADRVGDAPYVVVVQGHTDDVPISTGRFPSNWELAGARASRVVRILARDGIPPDRLSAVSFGEHSPRTENDTPKGRARNRRIEITLKPIDAASVAASAGEDPGADAATPQAGGPGAPAAAQPAEPAAAQ
jgi:chemotaxis protein MotB